MTAVGEHTPSGTEGPDFVVVGVQKSGTTWLGEMIAQHPGVLMRKKEIDFFIRYYHKGYNWYHNWFADRGGRRAGEITQTYIISPRPDSTHREFYPSWNPRRAILFWRKQPSARDEIKAHYPGIRVFAIFRDPASRAWSSYWSRRRRKERLGKRFVSFQKMWDDDGRWIRTRGFYADQLAYWRQAFPDFGVFFYEDIKSDPVGLMHSVFRFIDVDDAFVPQGYSRKVNKTDYTPMPPETRRMVIDYYRDQIERFQEMTGRDLSSWLKVE